MVISNLNISWKKTLIKDVEPNKKKFTSDLINIVINNIINKICSKSVKVNRIDSKSEFIYINKIKDSTYEIKININNINTNIRNSRIYESGAIMK